MVTFWGVLVVLGVLVIGRYSGDGRPSGEPTGRDGARPDEPGRAHTVQGDVALLAGVLAPVGRRWAAQRHAWEAFDRSLRPWDTRV